MSIEVAARLLLLFETLKVLRLLAQLGARNRPRRVLRILELFDLLPILNVIRLHRGADRGTRLGLLLPVVGSALVVDQRGGVKLLDGRVPLALNCFRNFQVHVLGGRRHGLTSADRATEPRIVLSSDSRLRYHEGKKSTWGTAGDQLNLLADHT